MEEYDRCPVTLTYVYTARNASKVMGCHGGFGRSSFFTKMGSMCVGISRVLSFPFFPLLFQIVKKRAGGKEKIVLLSSISNEK